MRPGDHRALHGHPWVFRGEFASVPGDLAPGEIVQVDDARGRTVGAGYANPASQILVRILTRGQETPDAATMRERLRAAVAVRSELLPGIRDLRLVHAEADLLPGLVVERMDGYIVVSPDTLGAEQLLLPWLLDDLAALGERGVVVRALSPSRQREGLAARLEMIQGESPEGPVTVREGELSFLVDLFGGQKTGHYFDQRENHALVAHLASGRRVLDAFSYSGGFALAAAQGGAASVTAVESSPEAAHLLRRNASVGDLAVEVLEENAFDVLRSLASQGEQYDLVVLDPPPFARGRAHVQAALRAYKEINLRAFKLLAPGGILCTASCSHAVSLYEFTETVRAAALDAGASARLLEVRGPSPDHPVRLEVPETDYLHFLVICRDSGFTNGKGIL